MNFLEQKTKCWIIGGLFLASIIGCQQDSAPMTILEKHEDKIEKVSSINYQYRSITDNKYNETTYTDSADVEYYNIDSSYHGFGLRALFRDEEYLFDGMVFEVINHTNKKRVQYDNDEVKADSSYFNNLPFFRSNPLQIGDHKSFISTIDTMIKDRQYMLYKNEVQQQSNSDSSQIVKYQGIYYLDVVSNEISQIKNVIIRSNDTLQIVDHFFSNYTFQNEAVAFPRFDELNTQGYQILSEREDNEEFTYSPIEVGAELTQNTYVDTKGQAIRIYGSNQKITMVMFSFIGCAPCEMALKDFNDSDYWFTDKINLYYSSFQNPSATLRRYLNKKEFAFNSFGMESDMIDDFSLYHAPSFVFIDPNGKIIKVVEGYDEEVRNSLFDLIEAN